MNPLELNQTIMEVAKDYGYEHATAEFIAFTDFKVQWKRSYNWIAFRVSDYLKDAPKEVIVGLAKSLFERINGNPDATYGKAMNEYVTAPEFSIAKREIHIKRKRAYLNTGVGEVHDLNEALASLITKGLMPADCNIKVIWCKDDRDHYSTLMRVIAIPKEMDDERYSQRDIEDVIMENYEQILEFAKGFQ